jgi:hypothetical protein
MTPLPLEDQAALRTARRQTLAAAGLALGGDVVGALIVYHLVGWDAGEAFRAAHAVIAVAVLLVLLRRPSLSRPIVLGCFLLLVVPVLPLLIVWTLGVPESRVMEPFIAQKMVIIGIALLTPESAVWGIVLTAIVVAEAVGLSALRLAGGRAGEPSVTIFYGLFAVGLLLHRASERRLAARLVRMSAEAAALERIAEDSMTVRDQLNTPLQTLEIGLALLRRRAAGDSANLIERLQSSVDRLKELSHRLARRTPTGTDIVAPADQTSDLRRE